MTKKEIFNLVFVAVAGTTLIYTGLFTDFVLTYRRHEMPQWVLVAAGALWIVFQVVTTMFPDILGEDEPKA